MIRINLLGVERKQARRPAVFDIGKRITLACSLVLVAAGAGIGLWYFSLEQRSKQVDADIEQANQQVARLRSIIGEVSKFEERKAQLQQRVGLIEQLRKGQSLPVQLLDQISRSVPDMLWLTSMEQSQVGDVTIEGRSTTMIALSDFVGNLGASSFFKKPIEIVESKAAQGTQGAIELVEFTVKAQLASTPEAPPAPARGRAPARGARQ
jgi:type IV pilus assembly protein PilN